MLLRGATLAALCVAASGFVGGAPWAARTTVGSAPLGVATAQRPAARSPLPLQLSAGDAEDEAKKEAQKWADMAARMKAQRAAAAGKRGACSAHGGAAGLRPGNRQSL